MHLSICTHLLYTASQPCDLLLQIEAFSDDQQCIQDAQIEFDPTSTNREIAGEAGLGTRRWVRTGQRFECRYQATALVSRSSETIAHLQVTPRTDIPSAVVKYLMPSRYCHSELFLDFVSTQFRDQSGGALVLAMRDWVNSNFTYDNAASTSTTTAVDSFKSLSGVCRDYAHVLITFIRAAGIPARFVSVYAPDVVPQDFHAVVEVYLGGSWHLVDPTGMAKPDDMVRICVGRDAADASFITSYGWMDLVQQSIEVHRLTP